MLSAEYGGTGGAPVEWGMIVEEPDIEIGAGVSSKAMGRRIATDQGGKRGPQSSRTDGREDDRYQRRDRRHDDRPESRGNNNAPPGGSGVNSIPMPNMPNMGNMSNMPFPFPTLPNGMPMMPPGFQFPFQFPPQNGDQRK